jgi:hypothetical protein
MRCEIESIESKAAKVRTRNAAAEICVLRFNSLTRLGINPGPHSDKTYQDVAAIRSIRTILILSRGEGYRLKVFI